MDQHRSSGQRALPSLIAPELATELLAEGLDVALRVTGSSMSPFLRSGDVVTVVPVATQEPQTGDIVVRQHGLRLLVHRLIAIETPVIETGVIETPAIETRWQTRGDAVAWPDRAVEGDELLGVVIGVEPAGAVRRFGLGPGRRLIAWLSARGLLLPLLVPVRMVYRSLAWLGSRKSGSSKSSADGSGRKLNS